MKTTTSALRTAAAVGALALSSIASAIPISSMTVNWNDAVGGDGVVYNQANGSFSDVRWGVGFNGGPPSGLGFDPATPVDPAAGTAAYFTRLGLVSLLREQQRLQCVR